MGVVGEHRPDAGPLAFGEQPVSGAQRAPHSVERVTAAAAVAQGVLLDALAAQVELLPGEGDDVERVHDRDRVGQLLDRGVLVAAEPVHRHDPHTVAEGLVAGGQPAGQRRRGAAR